MIVVIATKNITEAASGDHTAFTLAKKGQDLELIKRHDSIKNIGKVWKYEVRDIEHKYDSFFVKDGEVLPKKALDRISETEKTLAEYETTFEEYMKGHCGREVFALGSTVVFCDKEERIVCGWNDSCNYDVYSWENDNIRNVHPADIRRAK